MKIVLPKTLAEPLTIPWFVTYSEKGKTRGLYRDIHNIFCHLEDLGLLPKPDNKVSMSYTLRQIRVYLVRQGAIDVQVNSAKLGLTRYPVGYEYHVLFRSTKYGPMHIKIFDSYFK